MDVRMDSSAYRQHFVEKAVVGDSSNASVNRLHEGTTKAAAATNSNTQSTNSQTVNTDLAKLIATNSDAFFQQQQTNSTAGRLNTHKQGGQKGYSSNDKLAKGTADVSELLSNGSSAVATRVSLFKQPVDKTKLSEDRYLPKGVAQEKKSALIASSGAASGTTAKYKKTTDLADSHHPLSAEAHEDDGILSSIGRYISVLTGRKQPEAAIVGKRANFIA